MSGCDKNYESNMDGCVNACRNGGVQNEHNEGIKQRSVTRDKPIVTRRRFYGGGGKRGQPLELSPLSPPRVCLLVGCLTSQQQASVSQGRICSDNCTCCHTEIEVADPTFYLTQSQYTDTGPTSPSADPITPGAWQGSHWSANFEVTGMTRPRKNPGASGIRTRDLPLSRRTP